jgi:hypothetical protein
MTLTSHFVRRGMEAAHGMHKHGMIAGSGSESDDGSHVHPPQIPPVAALVFFLSGLLAIIIMFSVCSSVKTLQSYLLTLARSPTLMATSFPHSV